MTLELAVQLGVLALIDSTSMGTLVIPVGLMLHSTRIAPRRLLLYLGTVAGFYLALGLVLVAGASRFSARFVESFDGTLGYVVGLTIGSVLLVLGVTLEPWTKEGKKRRADRRAARRAARGPSRLERLRLRVFEDSTGRRSLVTLAVVAAVIETTSMLPYLGAMALITTADPSPLMIVGTLALYCLLMIAPALTLLVLRVRFHDRLRPLLDRVGAWVQRNSREATATILFLVGFFLTASSVGALVGDG
jgi:hypothetical protein